MERGELPKEVVDAQQAHPDCSISIDKSTTARFVNGRGEERQEASYYLRCPGKPRKLIHRSTESKELSGDDGGAHNGVWSFGSGSFGSGGGDGMPGLPSVFDGMDDFLKDFFGIEGDRSVTDRQGRLPFPLPLPRPQPPATVEESEGWSFGRLRPRQEQQQQQSAAQQPPRLEAAPQVPSLAQRERGKGVYI